MSHWDIKERPNLLPWPPMLLAMAILCGFILDQLLPIAIPGTSTNLVAGALVIGFALILDVWASLTFRKAQTTILPHQGSEALATGGPFRYSRNPIYLGNLLILVGVDLIFNSLWHFALVIPLALAIYQLAIRREEAHLAAKFPEDWASYSSKVRRWI